MIASAVAASNDAISQAPWDKGMTASSVWAWSIALDDHGPLLYHVVKLPERSATRFTLLNLAPTKSRGDATNEE